MGAPGSGSVKSMLVKNVKTTWYLKMHPDGRWNDTTDIDMLIDKPLFPSKYINVH